MLPQHKSHLIAVYTTALEYAKQIREAAVTGVSPTGVPLTPLPSPQQQELVALLGRLTGRLHDTMAVLLPDREETRPAPVSATRMWVNVLLGRLHELIEDLEPGRFSQKYGALDPQTARILGSEVKEMLEDLKRTL